MKRFSRFTQVGAQLLFVGFFAVLLAGCVTCTNCQKECGQEPDDPNTCPNIAVNVTVPNEPPGCIVNPGVSKKCSMTNKKCPTSRGPATCQTVVGAGGNCACQCPQ